VGCASREFCCHLGMLASLEIPIQRSREGFDCRLVFR
jgi:hypothetical protein